MNYSEEAINVFQINDVLNVWIVLRADNDELAPLRLCVKWESTIRTYRIRVCT